MSISQPRRRILLLTGLSILVLGALLLGRWSDGGDKEANSAAVLCGLGRCTASSVNSTISAAQGTVEYGAATILTWHADRVKNTIAGASCFGKDDGLSPCGTPYQLLYPGNIANTKRVSYIPVGSDSYLGIALEGGPSMLYKWMSPPPYSETSPLPVDTSGLNGSFDAHTQFDRSFTLDPGKTVKSISVYVKDASFGNVSVKIGKSLSTNWNFTVVVSQSCAPTASNSWLECTLATPYTVPNDGYAYYAGSYYGSNLGQTATPIAVAFRSGDQPVGAGGFGGNTSAVANAVRANYTAPNSDPTASGCFGSGSSCDAPYQILTALNSAIGGMRPIVIDGTTYIAVGQNADTSKIFKWLGAPYNCFGAGTTCGAVFQDLGTWSTGASGGLQPFTFGTDTYLAMGSEGNNSGIYKWLGSCFGSPWGGCNDFYQWVWVSNANARGGWEIFKRGGTTYLTLAKAGASSELYQAMPADAMNLGTAGGLTGQYFNNTSLIGPPVLTRQEAVNFDWGTGSPDPSVPVDNFSAMWSGTVVAPVSGNYTFYTGSDDGSRLYLGFGVFIEDWSGGAYNVKSQSTYLSAGQQVPIVLLYFEGGGPAAVDLQWSYPGQAQTPIPASALYSGYTHYGVPCFGNGTYCGLPQQYIGGYADTSSTGGFKAFTIDTDTYLGYGSEGGVDPSRIFKFMSSVYPVEPANGSLTTRGGGYTVLDRTWTIDNNRKIISISAWSPVAQTAYIKITKRLYPGRANTYLYDIVLSQPCTLNKGIWTECVIPGGFTTDATSEYHAGLYSPDAVAAKSYYAAFAVYGPGGNAGIGRFAFCESTFCPTAGQSPELRGRYEGGTSPITPCLGDGFVCGEVFQGFGYDNGAYLNGTFGWDALKVGTETYLAFGSTVDPSRIFRWMSHPVGAFPLVNPGCFGNGTTCGAPLQTFDAGAALKFFALGGRAYLASAGTGVDTKIYKGVEISTTNIAISPSITGYPAKIYWSAAGVNNCTITGPGGTTVLGPVSGTVFATSTVITPTAPTDGAVYTITCNTPSGPISKTAAAYVRSNFFDANQVYRSGEWPMESNTCATDGKNYTSCYKGNTWVSSGYGATALFGAHKTNMGFGTIVGQFTGHGGGGNTVGFEYTKTWSGPTFPQPPLKTKPEYQEWVVVDPGSTVDLEWTCAQHQNQNIQNGCKNTWYSSFCGDSHDPYDAYYSDSTVGTNFSTGGALYGKQTVTVNADTTYSVQCVSHHSPTLTFPAMDIDVYTTGSPNIPLQPWQQFPKTSGCTVYAFDAVNGTTTVSIGNDGGQSTGPLFKNTTFTLSCSMEDGSTEESSIRVLIPPVVSVATGQDAVEGATDGIGGEFSVKIDDPLTYDLPVNFTLSGKAVNGTDYASVPLTATIPAGEYSVTIPINPIDDYVYEGPENVVLTIAAGTGYRIATAPNNTASLNIVDNETAQSLPVTPTACTGTAGSTCSLAASPASVREGGTTVISWYVDKIITGANGFSGDTCSITSTPTVTWSPSAPVFSVDSNNQWIGSASATINSKTVFRLECVAPDGVTKNGVSKTVLMVPTFKEI